MTAADRILDALRSATGHEPRESAGRFTCRCPAHEDHDPSLSVRPIEGSVLLHCHAGCQAEDILAALHLELRDLYDDRDGATYVYDSGRVVHRSPDKRFHQSGDLSTVELFHLSRLLQMDSERNHEIYLVEGEKDVLAIESAGGIATTAPMGASNFAKVDVEPLRRRSVTVVVDRDKAGQQWAATVARTLDGVAKRVTFKQAAAGKDAADHVAAGYGYGEFVPVELDASGPDSPADNRAAAALIRELADQRVRREAKRILDAEARPPVRHPVVLTLRERLARPRGPVSYRIDGWQPVNTRVVLAAQFKAGKTTATGNAARSLVDGDLWLGQYKVDPIRGVLVILDFEMSEEQLDSWLADQSIVNDDRVVVIPMRGNAAAFDILDAGRRAEWAAKLRERGASYLMVDCLRPILDALGLDEQREAGRFLTALDALLAEAGVAEALVIHHMGHQGERSRGDSRIRDWPDVEWRLVRQDPDDPSSPRYISAYGRDVDHAEAQLSFNSRTRHLAVVGGTRKDAAAGAAVPDVLDLLAHEPKASGRKIEEGLASSTHTQKAIRAAVAMGIRDGQITVEPGPRGAKLHSLCVSASDLVATASTRSSECVSASIDDALHSDTQVPPVRQAEEGTCCEGGDLLLKCKLCRSSPSYHRRADR